MTFAMIQRLTCRVVRVRRELRGGLVKFDDREIEADVRGR